MPMSRMLEALRRIEAGSTQPRQQPDPPPAEAVACLPPPPEGPPQVVAFESQSAEAICSDALVQAELEQVEIACAAIAAASAPAGEAVADTSAEIFRSHAAPAGVSAGLVDHVLSQVSAGTAAVLLFTSPEDGTGKTSVLSTLAPALARRIEGELLLVDGNLRQPELSDRWEMQSAIGLADVLLGTAHWREVVRPTAVSRVSVLPGVKLPAAEARLPRRFSPGWLWQELSSRYRLVLVDAASLAHEEVTRLACHCTGTYLVVRLRHTSRRALAESIEVLQQNRGRLLGCVVIEG